MWFGIPVLLFLAAAASMFGGTFVYSLCVFCKIMINYRETFFIELHRATIYYSFLFSCINWVSDALNTILYKVQLYLIPFANWCTLRCSLVLAAGCICLWVGRASERLCQYSVMGHGIFKKQTAANTATILDQDHYMHIIQQPNLFPTILSIYAI